ncbi:MAG: hypothetical protein JNK64_25320 [Myxococcales bacterium]|nr:hypothetical protein [Myxococcales bacterium]
MPKPLRIFLPATPAYSTWTRVHDWGAPTASGGFEDHLRLETTAATPMVAACDGVLSIFASSIPLVGAPFVQPWLIPVLLPPTVSLYLNLRPGALRRTNLAGFLYRDIETSSLAPTLGAALDSVVIGTSPTTRDDVVQFLIGGMAHVPVTAGQPIGLPAPKGTGGTRQFGLAAIKSLGVGTIDPMGTFDDLRDEVEDGQPQVDLLLQAFPRPTDLFDPGLSEAAAIARTATRLYPWSTLQSLAARYNLGQASSQWRTIGNNQKALYLDRLRVRVGHGGTSTAPPFEFNDTDLHNVFQLEAIVEFYANFNDPWKVGATPVSSSTPSLSGAAARSSGNWVSLEHRTV